MISPSVLVIGAGPAGATAAVQLQRYGLKPLLLERWRVGGLLWNANLVENYPGFPTGIPGPKLAILLERHLQHWNIPVWREEVTCLDYDGGWRVEAGGRIYTPAVVVVASGTQSNPYPLEIPLEAQERVFSEVWPLRNVRKRTVVIVGAGDAAFDYALNLAGRGNTVTILNRGAKTKCLPLLFVRAVDCPLITYLEETTLQDIAVEALDGGLLVSTSAGILRSDYLLFAIGRRPRLDFLSESVKRQATKLTQDGKLYLIGDVHNGLFRQAAIAAGEGLRAAMQIYAKGALEQ